MLLCFQVTFTFQCIVATDGAATFAIFLYPQDGLAVGENAVKGVRNEVTARYVCSNIVAFPMDNGSFRLFCQFAFYFYYRAGFNDGGREQLEILSADELLG